MKKLFQKIFTVAILFIGFDAFAQTTVTGTLKDETGEPFIGATIQIKGKVVGTTSDLDGLFTLKTSSPPPFTLIISGIGVETQEVEITQDGQKVDITMTEKTVDFGNEVVISTSRVEEKIMQAPVTVEKLDAIAIRQSSTADYYDELAKLKGVQVNTGSMTFTSVNTRAFASVANTRFVQLMDGMDNAAPLLNFPTGNIVGIGELDINNIELLPGASSALYGPNAFNGILLMNSKSPFDYPGLSVQLKTGINQASGDANPGTSHRYPTAYQKSFNSIEPLYNVGIRYAKAINNRFAFKLNASYLRGQDWPANDYTTDRGKLPIIGRNEARNRLSDMDFDGMNLYGDEVKVPVGLDTSTLTPGDDVTLYASRTGWREEDILTDRLATSLKADAAIHFRPTENIELIANYRYGSGNSVYQGSERYILKDFSQQFAKLEAKGKNWFLRGYGSFTDDGNSNNLTALASYTNERIMQSANYDRWTGLVPGGWATAYNFAYGNPFLPNEAGNFLTQVLDGYTQPLGYDIVTTDANGNNIYGNEPAVRAFADAGGFGILTEAQQNALYGFVRGNVAASTAVQSALAAQGIAPAQMGAYMDSIAMHLMYYSGATELARNFYNDPNLPAVAHARPAVGTPEYTAYLEATRNGLFQKGGSGFIDASRLWHAEGNYDFSEMTKDVVDVLVGANFRRYSLYTNGTVFNEDPDGTGTNSRIGINEWGAYTQLTKRVLDDHLKFTGSIRYDKNQNFKGRFSPRLAVVASLGANKEHNFRASWQTGFRNPDTQAQYIYFPTSVTLLGGTPANNTYGDGTNRYHVYGEPVVTEKSILEKQQGLRTDLDTITLGYIQPERLTAIEVGYKGFSFGKLMVDANVYYNIYNDFQTQINVRNLTPATHQGQLVGLAGDGYTTFRAYTNQPTTITSWGAGLGLTYKLPKGFTAMGNYSYADYAIDASSSAQGFEPGFNTPKNRFTVGLENRDLIIKNFGFNLSYRWQQAFFWENSFGSGDMPGFGVADAQINYSIKKIKTIIKLGVTNVLGKEYQSFVGGPYVGRMAFLSLTFDEFMKIK